MPCRRPWGCNMASTRLCKCCARHLKRSVSLCGASTILRAWANSISFRCRSRLPNALAGEIKADLMMKPSPHLKTTSCCSDYDDDADLTVKDEDYWCHLSCLQQGRNLMLLGEIRWRIRNHLTSWKKKKIGRVFRHTSSNLWSWERRSLRMSPFFSDQILSKTGPTVRTHSPQSCTSDRYLSRLACEFLHTK